MQLVRAPIFGYGFRPFFTAAGAFALIAVPAWLVMLGTGSAPLGPVPASLWHGHEMIFGFVGAAIAGFLLTAVPSWTGDRGFAGTPLLVLTLVWLAGRAAFLAGSSLPLAVLAVIELAFLPALAALIAPPIVRAGNRNLAMLAVIAVLWSADAIFLLAVARLDVELASRALLGAMNVVLLLVTIIGGRIVPAFTGNALRQVGQAVSLRSYPLIERTLPLAMIGVIVVDAAWPRQFSSGLLAAAVALLHAIRLSGWRTLRVIDRPILWVLHAAYAWLPLGFALKAAALLAGAGWAQWWQHAFGIGVFATMILAVMTRASLGHTGRPLVVSPGIALAYGLATLAALVRVAAPALWPEGYLLTLIVAGALWTGAFAIFLWVYGPILASPRADGRPG